MDSYIQIILLIRGRRLHYIHHSGVFLTFEVTDAKAEYDKMLIAGIPMFYPLTNEAWGQKRFGVIDPNDMYIDVVEQTEPEDNYWDKYMTES